MLHNLLPPTKDQLLALLIRRDHQASDAICWGPNSNGLFTVMSAYSISTQSNSQHTTRFWNQIWKLQVPQRIRTFLWLAIHDKVMTNNERARRGFTSNPSCRCCHTPFRSDPISRSKPIPGCSFNSFYLSFY